MITQIITNKIKEGTKEDYIKVSKAFCEAVVARDGCLDAKVYEDTQSDTSVVNIVRWNSLEEAEALNRSATFREFIPQMIPYFAGNDTIVLIER